MDQWKKHLFDTHNDIDIIGKYKRDIESLVGQYLMNRYRQPILTMLRRGQFDSYVVKLIDPNLVPLRKNVKYDFNIHDDPDTEN